jgi:uncharacterized SAM-binding protein YcdF (DUF218 family)
VELRPKPGRRERLAAGAVPALLAGAAMLAASALGIDEVFGFSALWSLPPAIAAGFVAGAIGFGRAVRWIAGALLALLVMVLWIPWFGANARGYVRRDPLPTEPVDAIVVLSASVTSDGDLSPAGADRLLAGLDLYRKGLAPRLILSRVKNPSYDVRLRTSDEDQRRLIRTTGLEPETIVLDPVGTTRVEAIRAAEVASGNHWRRVIVVTSPVHTRRACATFEKVGFEVSCQPSRDRTTGIEDQQTPVDRARAFGQWLYEALGWRVYRARGWID